MEKKTVVVTNRIFKLPDEPLKTVKLFATTQNDGKEVWLDHYGNYYGPTTTLPDGYSLVVKDEDAEYFMGAKVVTGWEHNMSPRDMDILKQCTYAPAYIAGVLRRNDMGGLEMITVSDDLGIETNAEELMCTMFATLISGYAKNNELDVNLFLERIKQRIKNLDF